MDLYYPIKYIGFGFVFILALAAPQAFAQSEGALQNPRHEEALFKQEQGYGFREDSHFTFIRRIKEPFAFKGFAIESEGLRITPQAEFTALYNDNILAVQNDAKSSFAGIAKAGLELTKPFGRHSFGFGFEGEAQRYESRSEENVENYKARFFGIVEARESLTFPFNLEFQSFHNKRTNQRIEDITKTPDRVKESLAELGMVYKPNRFQVELTGQYTQRRLEDGRLITDGSVSVRKDRDVDIGLVNTKLSYEFGSGWAPFLSFTTGRYDYLRREHDGTDFNGPSRKNSFWQTLLGFKYDYKELLLADIGAGWESKDYKDDTVEDTDGLSLRASLAWFPSQKTKLSLSLRRRETDDSTFSTGLVEEFARLEMERELKQDIFGRLSAQIANNAFSELNRQDDIFGLEAGLRYIVSPRFQIGGEYRYMDRSSTLNGFNFDQNLFMITLNGSL